MKRNLTNAVRMAFVGVHRIITDLESVQFHTPSELLHISTLCNSTRHLYDIQPVAASLQNLYRSTSQSLSRNSRRLDRVQDRAYPFKSAVDKLPLRKLRYSPKNFNFSTTQETSPSLHPGTGVPIGITVPRNS